MVMVSNFSKRYPASVKAAAVRRYVTSETTDNAVAREFGCSVWSVRSWVQAASQTGSMTEERDMARRPDDRSPEEKLALMLEAASLSPLELGEFLRKNGLRDGDLERWKADATSGLRGGREYRGQSRRVRDLERQKNSKKKSRRCGRPGTTT